MEKQRNRSTVFISRRLLILSIILIFSGTKLFSQTLTAAKINELRIVPAQDQQLYTDTDITFEVFIPYIRASQLEFSVPEEMDNVHFKTMHKSDVYEENGAQLTIVLNFSKKGEYKLKALPVVIKGTRRSIKFNPVTVKLNPKNQKPALVLEFVNGSKLSSENSSELNSALFESPAGKKIIFRVSLQYGVNLVQFNYDIPKDSIFTKLRDYEINEVKYREKEYSDALIPIADFEWTPLAEGNIKLPVFTATIVSYGGYRNEVVISDCYIKAVSETSYVSNGTKDFYDSIFENAELTQNQKKSAEITIEDCQKLAELRTKEKYSLLPSVRHERIEFEKQLQLPYDQKEFPVPLLYVFASICGFFIFALIFCIRRHKTLLGIFNAALIICSFVLIIYAAVLSGRKTGICTGCVITSIPEENAAVSTTLNAGCRVKIHEEAGEWIFVEFGKIEGWCKKDDVLWI